jgi:hypothetical protein
MDALPKLDREAYRQQMRAEFERVLNEVADAVDEAPKGRVIRDSEERARDALDRFRQVARSDTAVLRLRWRESATDYQCREAKTS